MIQIRFSEDLEDAGVAVDLGCIASRVTVREDDGALGAALAREAEQRREALGERPVAELPEIAATRRAYRALGKDPTRYRPAAEALLRRVVQGKGLFRVNAVVDVNNLVSLRTGFSIGAYDLAALRPPIELCQGAEGLSYAAIGRGEINLAGLPVLIDERGPFGSPTSDSERSKVTPGTERLLMVIFAFERLPGLAAAVDFAVESLTAHCAAKDIETWCARNEG